jgi:hypothetical protein
MQRNDIPLRQAETFRLPSISFSRLLSHRETGAGEGNRTPDLRFTKPLLYRLSYAGVHTKKGSPGRSSSLAQSAGEHFERRIEWQTRSTI